ncbi:LysE family translocator [Enterovibrio makurazakiensis]|uniref:LysE family translocator n=1 Tax=Enterovibrio gelatinilyticus TaxID=2899819 RepID=A0ABT5R6M0_9GAMM|nr:LysE family translocator [Enterovibrio sp. ZSDZ42]MDD1795901.1 LysE family translocator [Enterovibrio sp. ZSDZ42]
MMELSFLVTLALFAATMTGTPGPNNMMLTASGANFGYRRTVPHLVGITLGVASLIAVVAAGLGVVFKTYPMVQEGMKLVASGYLLYLAWRIANAGAPSESASSERRPMTLMEAALFQYVNPKAWAMAVSAVGTFTLSGGDYWWSALVIVMAFIAVGFPLTSLWAAFGVWVGKALSTERSWVIFNRLMGTLTASCLLFIWM